MQVCSKRSICGGAAVVILKAAITYWCLSLQEVNNLADLKIIFRTPFIDALQVNGKNATLQGIIERVYNVGVGDDALVSSVVLPGIYSENGTLLKRYWEQLYNGYNAGIRRWRGNTLGGGFDQFAIYNVVRRFNSHTFPQRFFLAGFAPIASHVSIQMEYVIDRATASQDEKCIAVCMAMAKKNVTECARSLNESREKCFEYNYLDLEQMEFLDSNNNAIAHPYVIGNPSIIAYRDNQRNLLGHEIASRVSPPSSSISSGASSTMEGALGTGECSTRLSLDSEVASGRRNCAPDETTPADNTTGLYRLNQLLFDGNHIDRAPLDKACSSSYLATLGPEDFGTPFAPLMWKSNLRPFRWQYGLLKLRAPYMLDPLSTNESDATYANYNVQYWSVSANAGSNAIFEPEWLQPFSVNPLWFRGDNALSNGMMYILFGNHTETLEKWKAQSHCDILREGCNLSKMQPYSETISINGRMGNRSVRIPVLPTPTAELILRYRGASASWNGRVSHVPCCAIGFGVARKQDLGGFFPNLTNWTHVHTYEDALQQAAALIQEDFDSDQQVVRI